MFFIGDNLADGQAVGQDSGLAAESPDPLFGGGHSFGSGRCIAAGTVVLYSRRMFRFAVLLCAAVATAQNTKPLMTLDEFFDAVEIRNVRTSPDGHAGSHREQSGQIGMPVASATTCGYTATMEPGLSPVLRVRGTIMTRSGRPMAIGSRFYPIAEGGDLRKARLRPRAAKKPDQVWAISVSGGDAFAVTHGEEKVHAFAWSADSRKSTSPRARRGAKSGRRPIERLEGCHGVSGIGARRCHRVRGYCRGRVAKPIAATPWRVKELDASPNGKTLAFLTDSISQRQEAMEAYGIYLVDADGGQPRKLVERPAVLDSMHWAPDSRHIFFSFLNGSVEGSYQDAQPRVYWVDAVASRRRRLTRWAKFPGAGHRLHGHRGRRLTGHRAHRHRSAGLSRGTARVRAAAGTAGHVRAHLGGRAHYARGLCPLDADRAGRGLFRRQPDRGAPITSFNRLFTERALPEGQPYRWTADDGVTVEGMLIYPPGKLGAKNLRMLT